MCFTPSQVRFKLNNRIKIRVSYEVSIPHRFDSNEVRCEKCGSVEYCFNPSQVRFKHESNIDTALARYSFNPSQVRFKLVKMTKELALEGVSIPHRFDSNFNNVVKKNDYLFGFNPSQVRFKHLFPMVLHIIANLVSIPHRFDSN